MRATSIEQSRLEPTVFGALRRHWKMVLVVALLSAAIAVGYTLVVPEVYRANATVTVPQPTFAQGDASDQYLDSQVLLLQSQEVADRAVRIANAALNGNVLSTRDFSPDEEALKITPPEGTSPGSYGASIVAVSFTWPNPRVAQVGTNAVLQAFDDARVAAITAQGEATVAGIEAAMADARTRGQLKDLVNQRTQTLVNQQVDLATHPTVMWAAEPQVPINGNSTRTGAIGLVVGSILGAGLAYARAVQRRSVANRLDPAEIYHAPLISEVPASDSHRTFVKAIGDSTADPLPIANAPQSAAAEAYRFAAGFVERMRIARGSPLVVAFVSSDSDGARASVVANVALAAAQSGTTVLAIDADVTEARLTAMLLPEHPSADGFQQVLAGQRGLSDCLQPSTLDERLNVLVSGPTATGRTTGAAYSRAVEEMIGKAKASFDLVLINSPALLQLAAATELAVHTDAAIIVISPDELLQDHTTMVERLELVSAHVAGYIYHQARRKSARTARRSELPAVPTW